MCGKWSLAQFRGGTPLLLLLVAQFRGGALPPLLVLVARPPIIKLQARSTDRPTQLVPPHFDSATLALLII